MAEINEKILKYLVDLARIDLDKKQEAKLLKDLKSILSHFEELASLDTEGVKPMTGGTSLKNITREDEFNEIKDLGAGVKAFPESKDGYLKVPPIFE